MNLILDLQCFRLEKNTFVVKELAGYDGQKIFHVVFKPPFPFDMLSLDLQKQAKWLTNNHHFMEWCAGSIPLHLFDKILQDITVSADRVYVKGKEKADYIRKLISTPVIEFEEQPALEKSQPKCFYHTNNHCMCALSNVFYLYDNFVMS